MVLTITAVLTICVFIVGVYTGLWSAEVAWERERAKPYVPAKPPVEGDWQRWN